jgi:hypothetical protein
MSPDSGIKHVSDTALWVAHYRVTEAKRTNPIFADPLASILAGKRGRRVARSFPRSGNVAWGTVVRTSAADRLIGEALDRACSDRSLGSLCASGLFMECGSVSSCALLITEGFIQFISAPDVEVLARDLAAVRSCRYWITDFANLGRRRKIPHAWEDHLRAAPFLFA